jgi:predicted N-acetyltransferase YhbS
VPVIRDARDDEADALAGTLSRSGFGPTVAGLIAFPRESPHGDVLVADADGRRLGGVCCASFGATGWIGALGVVPEARGRGIGRALADAACERLRERGCDTVLLFATDMGRPLYERMGFEAEGGTSAWRGSAGRAASVAALRPVRDDDRPAVRQLDRRATGEQRDAVLDTLVPLSGVIAERDGAPAGWALTSPWGAGVGICADGEDAGVALMAAAAAGPEPATLVVPDANRVAVAALSRGGFQAAPVGRRMRLGPPGDWRPEHQFGLFNLFWG